MEDEILDEIKKAPDKSASDKDRKERQISRRDFLKKLGLIIGGAIISSSGFGGIFRWLLTEPERHIPRDVIQRELADDLELGELGKERVEYFFLWPYARIWVVVNNLLAASRINGLTFKRGETYSLIKLLDLEKSYKNNIDPQKGYITGLSLEGKRVVLVESQGLSLTANAVARTVALSPVTIEEWNTHTQIDEFTQYYFDPKTQIRFPPVYTHLGTDATVFYGENNVLDFSFTPFEDLVLKVKIMNMQGQEISLPNLLEVIMGYPESLTMRLTTPLLIRMALGVSNLNCYSIEMEPTERLEEGRIRPGFIRRVYEFVDKETPQLRSEERVFAYYDNKGKFFPKAG